MLALTLTQPFASLLVLGEKRIETRSWSTRHVGPVVITAAKGFPKHERSLCALDPFRDALKRHGIDGPDDLPTGVVLGAVELLGCHLMLDAGEDDRTGRPLFTVQATTAQRRAYREEGVHVYPVDEQEWRFGFWQSMTRYAWITGSPSPLRHPIGVRGRQRLWRWPLPEDVVLALDWIEGRRRRDVNPARMRNGFELAERLLLASPMPTWTLTPAGRREMMAANAIAHA